MSDVLSDTSIRINGTGEALTAATIADLLTQRGVATDGRGIAVALNGRIVRRTAWNDTRLSGGDDIEIVEVRQGG
jgi:sulfur carrier protein